MGKQFIAMVEHDARDTVTGSEVKHFIPIMGALQPTFTPSDEPREEFRGQDSALGDLTVVRRESQWTWSLELAAYPIEGVGILLKHVLGKAGTRAVYDTSAYKGIIYPDAMPFGESMELGDKALGFYVNTDEGGTTKSRLYFGARVKSVAFQFEGTDDVKLTFEVMGPGEYIDAEASETAGATFTDVSPFASKDTIMYVGAGISRTGTAPGFTDIDPTGMDQFIPDSMTITITNGLDDKVVMNGVQGPSKTHRASKFKVEISSPMDYEDPASGFSSADEYKLIFAGTVESSLALVLDNGELAGAAENYSWTIDLPNLSLNPGTPTRTTDGTQPSVDLAYVSLMSDTTEYPVAIQTIDKASDYPA